MTVIVTRAGKGAILTIAEMDANFVNLNTAKAETVSPTFTGTPTLPTGTVAVTQAVNNNTTAIATTAFCEAGFTHKDVGVLGIGSFITCAVSTASLISGATISNPTIGLLEVDSGLSIVMNTYTLTGTWKNISSYTLSWNAVGAKNVGVLQRIS